MRPLAQSLERGIKLSRRLEPIGTDDREAIPVDKGLDRCEACGIVARGIGESEGLAERGRFIQASYGELRRCMIMGLGDEGVEEDYKGERRGDGREGEDAGCAVLWRRFDRVVSHIG